jgi:23S rRNA (cytosine1962-C5)-methyltransferase
MLETYSAAGAFALQALRQGATEATALHSDNDCVKTIGANAQRNSLTVNAQAADPAVYLSEASAGAFEAIVLDPPADLAGGREQLAQLQANAFRILPEGGLLATYCRQSDLACDAFEALVADTAAQAGREARLFARTAQPFDFPILLNLPASQAVKGLILQVE